MNCCGLALALLVLIMMKQADALCVDQKNGHDVPACLDTETCCKSLTYPINMTNLTATRNVTLYLRSDITLNTVIAVEDFQEFVIMSSSLSKITCSNKGAGICVKNSNNIILSEIVLERCSTLIPPPGPAKVLRGHASLRFD